MKERIRKTLVKILLNMKVLTLKARDFCFRVVIQILKVIFRVYGKALIFVARMSTKAKRAYLKFVHTPFMKKWKALEVEMVGAIEKGIEAARFTKPPEGAFEGVDLRILPKYISFRAALLHNKLTQQYIILILAALLGGHFVLSRVEVYSLYGKLRSKEYILAPGVLDFTAASPQSVSDSYIQSAVIDFLGLLGNVSAPNIDEQYEALSDVMSPQLKIKFQAEAQEWKTKVKAENIAEILSIKQKEIRSNENGYYKVLALTRRDTYINNEYIGHVDEAIEMVLQLVPPKNGKRWFLEIVSLNRQSAESYDAKKHF